MQKNVLRTMGKAFRKAKEAACAAAVAAALGVSLPFGTANATGVPTVDVAAITQMLQQYMVLLNQLDQLESTVSQLEQTKSFMEATTTGMRAFAQANSTLALLDFMPADVANTLSSLRSGGLGGLSAQTRNLMNSLGAAERCAQSSNAARQACLRRYALTAMEISSYMAGQQVVLQRRNAITGMLSSIRSTVDPKGIADMQARIQQESASIQNEMARLEMVDKQIQAERKAAEEDERYASRRFAFGDGRAPTF